MQVRSGGWLCASLASLGLFGQAAARGMPAGAERGRSAQRVPQGAGSRLGGQLAGCCHAAGDICYC